MKQRIRISCTAFVLATTILETCAVGSGKAAVFREYTFDTEEGIWPWEWSTSVRTDRGNGDYYLGGFGAGTVSVFMMDVSYDLNNYGTGKVTFDLIALPSPEVTFPARTFEVSVNSTNPFFTEALLDTQVIGDPFFPLTRHIEFPISIPPPCDCGIGDLEVTFYAAGAALEGVNAAAWGLDNVVFYEPVPEPISMVLLILGSVLVACCLRGATDARQISTHPCLRLTRRHLESLRWERKLSKRFQRVTS